MANLNDPAPTGSWRKNPDILWVGTISGDPNATQLGIGQKALGKFALNDTVEKSLLWKKLKL